MSPKEFLSQLTVMTIAVIDEEGKPWAVPVKIQTYQNGEITWVSKTTTVHSRAIERSPEIMINAFDKAGMRAIYARAMAEKTLPTPGVGTYRARIFEAWYTDATHKKSPVAMEDL